MVQLPPHGSHICCTFKRFDLRLPVPKFAAGLMVRRSDIPICMYPVSTHTSIDCTSPSSRSVRRIVNGSKECLTAFPDFSSLLARYSLVGINFVPVRLITATAITAFLLPIPPPDDGSGDLRLPHQMRMHPMWTLYPFVPALKGRLKRSWLFSSPMLSIV